MLHWDCYVKSFMFCYSLIYFSASHAVDRSVVKHKIVGCYQLGKASLQSLDLMLFTTISALSMNVLRTAHVFT